MRHNRKGIPKQLKEVKSREEKSVVFMQNYKNNIMLVSYIGKKKSGKKMLSTAKNTVISPDFLVWKFCGKTQLLHSFGGIALTTMHDTVKVTNDE